MGPSSDTQVIVQSLKLVIQTRSKFFVTDDKLTLSKSLKVFLRRSIAREKPQMDRLSSATPDLSSCSEIVKGEDGCC